MLTLTQVWGALLIFTVCPVVGALPLAGWMIQGRSRDRLPPGQLRKTGVPGAAYYGGELAGFIAVLIEVAKGLGAVLLARYYFPTDAAWEIIALIALVMGRYWGAKAPGTTSVLAGSILHDPVTAGLTLLISFLGFTIFREKRQGRLLVVGLFPLIAALRHPQGFYVLLIISLGGLVGWIYQQYPEDLDVTDPDTRLESARLFGFFRSDRALLSLERLQSKDKVGSKIAILSQLMAWGYPVPKGYALLPGDDPVQLIEITRPATQAPVIIRASAVGDSPLVATSAGQYPAVANITSQDALFAGMTQCFRGYERAAAVQYRRDRGLADTHLAILVQQQVQGLCGGIAFSRDPMTGQGGAVVIEARLGDVVPVVAGQATPERYRVWMQDTDIPERLTAQDSWRLPDALTLTVEGEGDVPTRLLQQVAFLARHVERRSRGVPQSIEWSFDGDRLWLLQSRPVLPTSPAAPKPSALTGDVTAEEGWSDKPGLQGLPVSAGQVEGIVRYLKNHQAGLFARDNTILVLPYLNAAELPLLADVKGFIAFAGGQLSHGAIVAREYGIPTVIFSSEYEAELHEGQKVWLHGDGGSVKFL